MSNIQPKITRYANKPLKMTHNQESSQPIETIPEISKMIEVEESVVNICYNYIQVFKGEHEHWRKNKRYKKDQMELLKMKNTISEMTNTPGGIFNRLDTVEKKLLNLWT